MNCAADVISNADDHRLSRGWWNTAFDRLCGLLLIVTSASVHFGVLLELTGSLSQVSWQEELGYIYAVYTALVASNVHSVNCCYSLLRALHAHSAGFENNVCSVNGCYSLV
jgi:hypothetical protein